MHNYVYHVSVHHHHHHVIVYRKPPSPFTLLNGHELLLESVTSIYLAQAHLLQKEAPGTTVEPQLVFLLAAYQNGSA